MYKSDSGRHGEDPHRLAHLSDIHITAPDFAWQREDWFNKRLAAWINFRWLGRRRRFRHAADVLRGVRRDFEERGVQHIIFSGDATALGFESEMRLATELLQVGGNIPGLAVPGNHDYCTPSAASSGCFERYFAPWQTGVRVSDDVYPFAQRVGPAWLVAVNSCTGNRWAWDAGGSVGPGQLQRLEKLLAQLEPAPRILVTHYPVCLASGRAESRTHGLRDLADVVAVAQRGGVCLWLHGHRHGAYFLPLPGLASFPVICAGSATQTHLWNYFEYDLFDDRLEARARVFSLTSGTFQPGASFQVELTVNAGVPPSGSME